MILWTEVGSYRFVNQRNTPIALHYHIHVAIILYVFQMKQKFKYYKESFMTYKVD